MDRPLPIRHLALAGALLVTVVACSSESTGPPPVAAVVDAGGALSGQVGTTVQVRVRVEAQDGSGIPGIEVRFSPQSGGVSPSTATSGSTGLATTTWTLGQGAGSQSLEATAESHSVSVTADAQPGPPASTVKVSGDGQTGVVALTLANPIRVRVEDAFQNPLSGVQVDFVVTSGGGSAAPAQATTSSAGTASTDWTLGPTGGSQTLEARVAGVAPARFTATATGGAGGPTAVVPVRGDGQTGVSGTPAVIPPQARVVDGAGAPVAGVAVTFQVTAGGGSVSGAVQTSDANGLVMVGEWVLGAAGTNTVQATSPGLASADFTATGQSVAPAFDIEVRFVGASPPADQAQAFLDAEARWEAIVLGDLPSSAVNLNAGACGVDHPATNETVDDVLIFAQLDSIDGPGATLGQAGPCIIRSASRLTVVGRMQFDTADLALLQANGQLDEVAVHEMGHVLGFIPNIWDDLGLIAGENTDQTRFLGEGAVARYEQLAGPPRTSVPLEDGQNGGGGADAHWEEDVFDNEIMTGVLQAATANPLSVLTIAALWDMGYVVDMGQAEAYTLSGAPLTAQGASPSGFELRELPFPEVMEVGPDGRPRPLPPRR